MGSVAQYSSADDGCHAEQGSTAGHDGDPCSWDSLTARDSSQRCFLSPWRLACPFVVWAARDAGSSWRRISWQSLPSVEPSWDQAIEQRQRQRRATRGESCVHRLSRTGLSVGESPATACVSRDGHRLRGVPLLIVSTHHAERERRVARGVVSVICHQRLL